MPGASFVTMAMAARIRMKMPLTSDALLDTMPANTSFQMLSCFSLTGWPFSSAASPAGSVASSLFFAMRITPLPSRRT